ncbi:uncharacterized protein LOC141699771 [Apium graveolens]|uniref:uncharacterized protein LOC141699771 n=1 Tax=Apium graveolens TaxID=4045 RepID=UPI003D7BE2E0
MDFLCNEIGVHKGVDAKIGGRHGDILQIEWMCPAKLTLDINSGVAAGQESIEATWRRVPTDPRFQAEPTDHSDSTTLIIPIEEKGNLLNNSSPFLTTSSVNDEIMSMAIDALNALNGVALGQGEPVVDLGMFKQWLDTDTVRKFFSGQSFTGIEPTKSVPRENPDQFYRVRENTGVVIPKPIAWTSSVPAQDVLDLDLLARLLQNPGDVEKLIKIYDSTAKGKSCASAIATIPESLLTFPRENTAPGHISHCITSESSAPSITVSSMVTSSSNKSLINNDIPLPEATMTPMSPLYYSPSTNWESDIEIESPISENGTVAAMGLNPLVNDFVTLLMVNQQAAANMIAAFSHSTRPTNCSSLHANTQIVGQGPSTLNPHQEPCTYLNTPRGCRNDANCRYLHSKSDHTSPS